MSLADFGWIVLLYVIFWIITDDDDKKEREQKRRTREAKRLIDKLRRHGYGRQDDKDGDDFR